MARDAIENSLSPSRGFSFDDLRNVIRRMVEENDALEWTAGVSGARTVRSAMPKATKARSKQSASTAPKCPTIVLPNGEVVIATPMHVSFSPEDDDGGIDDGGEEDSESSEDSLANAKPKPNPLLSISVPELADLKWEPPAAPPEEEPASPSTPTRRRSRAMEYMLQDTTALLNAQEERKRVSLIYGR